MERPHYLSKYIFGWELLEVVIGGKSALDSDFFISPVDNADKVNVFLKEYGLEPTDPVTRAELFGNFQEALQFIKRYLLREGNPDAPDLSIPHAFSLITDVGELMLMAQASTSSEEDRENALWAEVILKVMHTILHVDKDLRSSYFPTIQTQVFDRFYKYLHRDDQGSLFLGEKNDPSGIPIVEFETKSQKSRDSVIIKLLHKVENVAEELFDQIGIRIVTESRFDIIRVIAFLMDKFVILPHNIKPSRSLNSLVDTDRFKRRLGQLTRKALKSRLDEGEFLLAAEKEIQECHPKGDTGGRNLHSAKDYRSIQFTCRQLIKYKNPFLQEFNELRNLAKTVGSGSGLTKKILSLDTSPIAKEVKFFFPYEIQIVDAKTHKQNNEGEASHQEYKRAQTQSAALRVLRNLLEYKDIATN